MIGGSGSDRFVLQTWPTSGSVVIDEAIGTLEDGDELILPEAASRENLIFRRSGGPTMGTIEGLEIRLADGSASGSVFVERYFHDDPLRAGLEVIRLADGSELRKSDVIAAIGGLAGTDGNDVLRGYRFAETLDGGAGDDQISGEAGDDTLLGGEHRSFKRPPQRPRRVRGRPASGLRRPGVLGFGAGAVASRRFGRSLTAQVGRVRPRPQG